MARTVVIIENRPVMAMFLTTLASKTGAGTVTVADQYCDALGGADLLIVGGTDCRSTFQKMGRRSPFRIKLAFGIFNDTLSVHEALAVGVTGILTETTDVDALKAQLEQAVDGKYLSPPNILKLGRETPGRLLPTLKGAVYPPDTEIQGLVNRIIPRPNEAPIIAAWLSGATMKQIQRNYPGLAPREISKIIDYWRIELDAKAPATMLMRLMSRHLAEVTRLRDGAHKLKLRPETLSAIGRKPPRSGDYRRLLFQTHKTIPDGTRDDLPTEPTGQH